MDRVILKTNHLEKTNSMDNFQGKNVSYIVQYLSSLGISKEDMPSFLECPRDTDEDNPSLLDNIDTAVIKTNELLQKGAKVFVQVDSDTDGYTSSSILINYLRLRFPNINIVHALHPGKEHGIVLESIPSDAELIFIPDAGSNDFKEQAILAEQGKTVIILDHHEVDNYQNTGAILVNNQTSKRFPNKNMSGAGIVYMFIKRMDEMMYPGSSAHCGYQDLAAIGIIADAMNMTSLGNNYLAYYGLKNIQNKFIQALVESRSFSISNPKSLTKIDVAFYIAPVINGVIRYGAQEDKEAVFEAMSNDMSTEIIETVWRGNTRQESIYEYAVRLASNAKSRQDAAKKKSFEWLCNTINERGLNNDNLIIVDLDEKESSKVNPTITGLIAMELVKEYNKPALVLRKTTYDDKEVYGGSGRNGNFYGLPDLKAFCHEAGVYYAEGHANAFGAFLLPDQVQKVRQYANEHLSASSFEKVYEVDYYFHNKLEIDLEMLYQMASYENLWGNSIPQPKFAFEFDFTDYDVVIMGKDRSSLKIKCGEISFVAFKNEDLVKLISSKKSAHALIIGRSQLNSWNGNFSIQVVIEDIELSEAGVTQAPSSLIDLI